MHSFCWCSTLPTTVFPYVFLCHWSNEGGTPSPAPTHFFFHHFFGVLSYHSWRAIIYFAWLCVCLRVLHTYTLTLTHTKVCALMYVENNKSWEMTNEVNEEKNTSLIFDLYLVASILGLCMYEIMLLLFWRMKVI